MTDDNEWLFNIVWELSDKAHDAGLPLVSAKLEEAMDVYLSETRPDYVSPSVFEQLQPDLDGDQIDPFAKVNARWVRRLANDNRGADHRLYQRVSTGGNRRNNTSSSSTKRATL